MFRHKHPDHVTTQEDKLKKKSMGESNISRPSFKLNAMKQKPALRSIISTREEQHDNTGIHANPWCSDQSTQMASWQLAYCWIIHSLHQAGKKSSMGPGDSAFSPLCPCWCCQTTADKNVTSVKFPHFLIFFLHKLGCSFNLAGFFQHLTANFNNWYFNQFLWNI